MSRSLSESDDEQGDLFAWEQPAAAVAASVPPALGAGVARSGASPLPVAGVEMTALPEGALWWERERMLVVADLHLEKGSSCARRGELLPPYDTRATLAVLLRLVDRLRPATVMALGDSFHDDGGPDRMAGQDRASLAAMQRGRDWVWIAGNHDAALPKTIGGVHAEAASAGPLTFRHEPTAAAAAGEIAGHLHPAARVGGPLGSVRRRCFVSDGSRAVLPAFGAFTGGLNVLAAAFAPLFSARGFGAFVLGADAVYAVHPRYLRGG